MAQKKFTRSESAFNRPAEVVNMFIDQPCSFQAGPYVTKLTLGVDDNDGQDFPRPTITIAMPTVNLIRMVEDLQKVFADPNFKLHNLNTINEDLKTFYGIDGAPPSSPKPRKLKAG